MSARPGPSVVVPVLCYHAVCEDPPPWIAPFAVTPRALDAHLDALRDAGRTVIPLARLLDALHGGPAPPPHAAVLTFDDAFADVHRTVAPRLAARGLPATVFVTTRALDGCDGCSLLPPAPMLTWPLLRELAAAGLDVGAHSRTHPHLDVLPRRAAAEEVAGSRRDLQDELGLPVPHFAYPHGYSSPAVREAVREAGYRGACGVGEAFSSPHDDPWRVARLLVRARTGPDTVAAWAAGLGAPAAPRGERARTRAWRAYRTARARTGRPVRL